MTVSFYYSHYIDLFLLQNLAFGHLTSVGAEVSLENDVFEYDENASNINICVRLKSSIKINIAFSLNILNGTALGKLLKLFLHPRAFKCYRNSGNECVVKIM